MKCKTFQKYIDDYINGSLSAEATENMKTHAEQCSACSRQLSLARSIKKDLAMLQPVPLPHDFLFRLRANLASQKHKPWYTQILSRGRLQAAAAAVIAIPLLILFVTEQPFYLPPGEPAPERKSFSLTDQISTDRPSSPPAASKEVVKDQQPHIQQKSIPSSKIASAEQIHDRAELSAPVKRKAEASETAIETDYSIEISYIAASPAESERSDSMMRSSDNKRARGLSPETADKQSYGIQSSEETSQTDIINQIRVHGGIDIVQTRTDSGISITYKIFSNSQALLEKSLASKGLYSVPSQIIPAGYIKVTLFIKK